MDVSIPVVIGIVIGIALFTTILCLGISSICKTYNGDDYVEHKNKKR